ncbi:IS21-like element helper ATPase IstB [Idiomarina aquatica]|uniref:AAA family ATPase n=1 Tax=Idiomarina aquatica TaxID=1327752 RepID=A0AA94JEU3_9GAMM|nr:IS21-like element helper ATPase IstB [Idiomarina aquatica]RUO45615.1 AAA family ATPase [Idiomarina aquatica]
MMLKNKITSNLSELKLHGMVSALKQQFSNDNYEDKGFLQRLDELVVEQLNVTSNARTARMMKQAAIRFPAASIGDINYSLMPSLKPAVVKELAELEWLKNHRHIIITGPTGTGKTSLASAFGNAVISSGIPAIHCRFKTLILNLAAADTDKRAATFRRRVEKAPLLIIDDWGTAPLSVTERHSLFELIEKRDQNSSLLITSQFAIVEWHDAFGDATVADSTLDRIVHSAHKIVLKGESIRKLLGLRGSAK